MFNKKDFLKDTQGNALFLILIAVALFAALSYAVTQSGRGGGGIDREQAAITAAEMTQYAAGLRTAAMRMTITGVNENQLDFDPTDDASSTPADDDFNNDVFMSEGGGAIQQDPPGNSGATSYIYLDATASSPSNGWYVWDLGSNAQPDGREVLVAANGLDANVCSEINRGLGLDPTPVAQATAIEVNPDAPPSTAPADGGNNATFGAQAGEPFACIRHGGASGALIYYHVLAEQ